MIKLVVQNNERRKSEEKEKKKLKEGKEEKMSDSEAEGSSPTKWFPAETPNSMHLSTTTAMGTAGSRGYAPSTPTVARNRANSSGSTLFSSQTGFTPSIVSSETSLPETRKKELVRSLCLEYQT